MTEQPFTDQQLAALRELVADAVHEAVAPIARQTTTWLHEERKRLQDPRRTATGAPVGSRPARPAPPPEQPPTGVKQAPPVAPEVHTFDGYRGRG